MEVGNMSNCTNCSAVAGNVTEAFVFNKVSFVPLFLAVYTVILSFAVLGNGLVCWVVKANKNMHNMTNYLLVNLAVSDLLQAISSISQVTDTVVKDLHLGDVACKFQVNMLNIPYGSSCLTLTAIAIERYFAVCKPLRFKGLKTRIKWIVPLIWLLSFCVYFPTIYFCGARQDKMENQLSCDCTYRWPSLQAKNIYGIFVVVIFYFLPCVVVVGFYSNVIRTLRAAPPGDSESTIELHRIRQRAVKMLLVTIVLFFVLWTPYNILYLLKRLEVDYRSIYSFVWYPALLLAFLSCAYNPLVYCLMGQNFRDGFKSVLRHFHCVCRVPPRDPVSRSRSASKATVFTIEMD